MGPKRKFSSPAEPEPIESGRPRKSRKFSKANCARKASTQHKPTASAPLRVTRSISKVLTADPAITRDTTNEIKDSHSEENGDTASTARSLFATSINYQGISSNTGVKGLVTNRDDGVLESPRGTIYDSEGTVLNHAPIQGAHTASSGAQKTRSEGLRSPEPAVNDIASVLKISEGSNPVAPGVNVHPSGVDKVVVGNVEVALAVENGANSMQHGSQHISGSDHKTTDHPHPDICSKYDSFELDANVMSGMILRMKHTGALLRKQENEIAELKRKLASAKAEIAKLSLSNGIYIKAAWHIDTLQDKILRLQQDLSETERERGEAEDTIYEKEKIIRQQRQGLESLKAKHKCEVEMYKERCSKLKAQPKSCEEELPYSK